MTDKQTEEKLDQPTKTNGRVTMRDIAEIVGVSPSTVSRVLNGGASSELISQKTREKVYDVAAKLDFTPNPMAKALRGGSSNLIGLLVREIADPFFSTLIQALSNAARNQGYQLVLGYVPTDPDTPLKMAQVLDTRYIDGVIVMGDLRDEEHALVAATLENNPAVVALCRGTSPSSFFTINIDNIAGIQVLFQHLYDLGHRQIGFLECGWVVDIAERKQAYLDCMQNHGLMVETGWIQQADSGMAGGYAAMQAMIDQDQRPTAVLAADDLTAVGALKAAQDSGLHVPHDISITGFDDIEIASYVAPGLTTVRQPIPLLAENAINHLISLMQPTSPDQSEAVIFVQPELVIRGSTNSAY